MHVTITPYIVGALFDQLEEREVYIRPSISCYGD